MDNVFLTIDDAPNYEINPQHVVREKATGKILPQHEKNGKTIVRLLIDGTYVTRLVSKLYKQAIGDYVHYNVFVPIFSAPNYEINRRGKVRNRKTKRILKLLNNNKVRIYINGQAKDRSISNLLYETFGVKTKNARLSIPLFVSKGNLRFHFDSLAAAARFLSKQLFLSFAAVHSYFTKRRTDIYGWRINYLI